ncbi:MAG TPA: hypothetical protein VF070_29560 [Streptosporangiaceae bacterium]
MGFALFVDMWIKNPILLLVFLGPMFAVKFARHLSRRPAYQRELARSEWATAVWNDLAYCHRCDCVWLPDDSNIARTHPQLEAYCDRPVPRGGAAQLEWATADVIFAAVGCRIVELLRRKQDEARRHGLTLSPDGQWVWTGQDWRPVTIALAGVIAGGR